MAKRYFVSPARCRGTTDAGNVIAKTIDGNLVIIHQDGTQEQISSEVGAAVFSADDVHFETSEDPSSGLEICRVATGTYSGCTPLPQSTFPLLTGRAISGWHTRGTLLGLQLSFLKRCSNYDSQLFLQIAVSAF